MFETKNDCYHYFDLNKMSQWVVDTTNDKPIITVEKGFDNGGDCKIISQIEKTNQNGVGIRGDLIMTMINTLFMSGAKLNEDNTIEVLTNEDELPVSSKIILNSFERSGFMVNKMDV